MLKETWYINIFGLEAVKQRNSEITGQIVILVSSFELLEERKSGEARIQIVNKKELDFIKLHTVWFYKERMQNEI